MSYCRFSTDDFQSDIYCYESEDGFVIHVASNRIVFAEPLPAKVELNKDTDAEAWLARHNAVNAIIEKSELVKIGLPHDGESFCFETPTEAADELKRLEEIGYRVPDGVIQSLHEEAAEAIAL